MLAILYEEIQLQLDQQDNQTQKADKLKEFLNK